MNIRLPDRFIRTIQPDPQGVARVGAQQIFILPTRYGLGFALMLILIWIGAINYANNLGFLLAFLLAGLGLVAMLHTWRNLLGLELSCGAASAVFKGERAPFTLYLRNNRRDERAGLSLQFEPGEAAHCDLAALDQEALILETPATRRGRLLLPRLRLATTYPLGLLYAWCYLDLPGETLVYPAPGPRHPSQSPPSYQPNQRGDKGVGADDFVGLRSYRPGDSPRQIDWKAQAREQGLHTKQFGGDRADQQWLDWQQYPQLDAESRLSALCRDVLDLSESNQAFGLRLPGQQITPASGERHRNQALAALALFEVDAP